MTVGGSSTAAYIMSQVYAAMSSMSMSIRGNSSNSNSREPSSASASDEGNISSSSSNSKKGEEAAVEFAKKRDDEIIANYIPWRIFKSKKPQEWVILLQVFL